MAILRDIKKVILLVSIIGNVALLILWQISSQKTNTFAALKERYPLLAERVLQDEQNDVITNFLPLRQQIDKEVAPYQDEFAMYFEYLPTGTSIGVNQDSEFTAASLLKVPVVMAYYHKREAEKIILDPEVTIEDHHLNKKFGEFYKKGAGAKVKLSEAVTQSLTKSDNTASLLLADQISDDDFRFVYEGLDIPLALKGDNPILTAEQYTSILKALYYSSVLTQDNSQEILHLLTQSKFDDYIPSGVPDHVLIAHKIGLIDKQIYQDCGIIYVPQRPYIVCMISKSKKKVAKERIGKLSKMIYTYVSGMNQ